MKNRILPITMICLSLLVGFAFLAKKANDSPLGTVRLTFQLGTNLVTKAIHAIAGEADKTPEAIEVAEAKAKAAAEAAAQKESTAKQTAAAEATQAQVQEFTKAANTFFASQSQAPQRLDVHVHLNQSGGDTTASVTPSSQESCPPQDGTVQNGEVVQKAQPLASDRSRPRLRK